MKFLMTVTMPLEPFNTLIRNGMIEETMGELVKATKPESAYFTATDGFRSGVFIVNMNDASEIPGLAEPWFLKLNATMDMRPVMSPEDLMKAGLDDIGKAWG
jgi:hypothetical protein